MSDDVKIYLIVQSSIRIVIDISFLVLYLLRIYKLDRMASNNFHQKPKLMRFKIILIAVLEILFATHIALAYTQYSYYMYPYQSFALVFIAQIINCLLQIYIIKKQHKKKALKVLKVPILWILWTCLDIIHIVFMEIKNPNITIILIIFQAMVLVALIILGCAFEQRNDERQQFVLSPHSPMLSQSRNNTRIIDDTNTEVHDENKLYVQFNKEFNVSIKNSQAFYEFKFVVFIGEESKILTKTESDFINLMKEMSRAFPQSEELVFDEKKCQSFSNMTKYGEEKQKIYEAYLIRLAQNQKHYTPYLLDFLEVSGFNRTTLAKKRENNMFQKKDSLPHEDEERQKKPFFTVTFVKNKISISNEEILEIVLNKSKSEIEKFHNKLIAQKKLKMQLLTENPDTNQYVHFIFRVVNSKYLWRSFCEWLVLGKDLEEKIYNMFDFWNYGFNTIKISIIGYEIAFDKEGSIHNLYLVSLSQRKSTSSNIIEQYQPQFLLKEDVTLKKRFNDFVKLDKSIKKFINTYNIKQQSETSLPPKFSPFGTKTSPKSRQIYLDMYLNEVIKIEGINRCVKFLQFLEVDTGKFREEFKVIDEEKLASENISSMVIDMMLNDKFQ